MKLKTWKYLWAASVICFALDRGALAATSNEPMFAAKTAYNGLIYNEDGMVPQQTGYFRINVSRSGSFTGQLLVGRQRARFHGKFNEQGAAYVPVKITTGYEVIGNPSNPSENVPRPIRKLRWTLVLQLTNGLDQVTGQIISFAQSGWTASVLGDRARASSPANPSPQAGQYTVVIPADPDGHGGPEGHGYGTVKVDESGNIRFLGVLPDGCKTASSALLSEAGIWPLFVSLREGKGVLLGWLYFTNSAGNDITGRLHWMRLSQPRARLYPEGFTNQTSILASRYVRPTAPDPVLALTNAVLVLHGGGLSSDSINSLSFRTPTELTGSPVVRVTVKFSPSTGLFTGRTEMPGQARALGFAGAVLQNQNAGLGYFLGTSGSGEVMIGELWAEPVNQ